MPKRPLRSSWSAKKGARSGDVRLLFVDETTLSLHPPLRACWMKRGEQKRVSTPGQQVRHHVIGAYDWLDNTVTWIAAKHKNSTTFIAFLEQLLLERYPDQAVVLVLDNASFHRSHAALAALSLFEHRVGVFWLPPYCSTLNPVERIWRYLKDRVCVNKRFAHMDHLVTAVERELSELFANLRTIIDVGYLQ